MSKARVLITLGCCLFALANLASAQNRKAGLWSITTTMHYESQNPMAGRPSTVGPYTTSACLSQALIDKYGAPLPQVGGTCKITSLNKQANSVKAEMACTGRSSGTATMESTWTATTATGSVHFTGTPASGSSAKVVKWSSTSTSVFKSKDCGNVLPFPMPN